MSLINKKVDVIGEIASFTGLKLDVVKLVLDAFELTILDNVLESQLSDEEEVDFIEIGPVIVDTTQYPKLHLAASPELDQKITETIRTGRDFLSESIILKFNADLLERYNFGETDILFDVEPSIYMGDSDE